MRLNKILFKICQTYEFSDSYILYIPVRVEISRRYQRWYELLPHQGDWDGSAVLFVRDDEDEKRENSTVNGIIGDIVCEKILYFEVLLANDCYFR